MRESGGPVTSLYAANPYRVHPADTEALRYVRWFTLRRGEAEASVRTVFRGTGRPAPVYRNRLCPGLYAWPATVLRRFA